MDKKKKIIIGLILSMFFIWASPTNAQTPNVIQFGNESHKYDVGNDSITFFLKVLDEKGKRMPEVNTSDMVEHFVLIEDGDTISKSRWNVKTLTEGQRIPADFTFSILVDLNIPKDGKKQIFTAVDSLVASAHDSCVFLSFFGDDVSQSQLVTKQNCREFEGQFKNGAEKKYFYSALYGKLSEFEWVKGALVDSVRWEVGYDDKKNEAFKNRVQNGEGKNLLFVFAESSMLPSIEEIDFPAVVDYNEKAVYAPKVFAFFYDAGNGISEDMESTLQGVTEPRDANHEIIPNRRGFYMSSNNIDSVLTSFKQAVRNEMYDFALTYKVPEKKTYSGGIVNYEALWDDERIGESSFSTIGTPENSWPKREESTSYSLKKYLIALIVTLATIVLFIIIMKILIPGIKSKTFAAKYYKRYKPVALSENVKNVKLRCPLCRMEIMPDEKVVTKCKHIMHVNCWKVNDYKCVEYGQNCKEGIQDHVHWKELFSMGTLRDCFLAIMGIMAGFVSWMIYELTGRGLFKGMAAGIVKTFFGNEARSLSIIGECVNKVSSFLTIGLLLAFFLSLIFRNNDGVKRKDWKSLLKITGLSLLSSVIGMAAFALGSIILCLCLSPESNSIPWYYSFPAYLLFSVCTSLSLTIKSTIPIKSALLGGLVSAVIGFFVLYFSSISKREGWMNMLLDFVIYGGGLGASLVTVRMLAEKYFLVIKDGIKAGTKIPIHKWMNANGGGHKVTIGMTQQCEIMMNWEKSNKVAKEHVQLYIDHTHSQAMMRPLAFTVFNMRTELNSSNKPVPLYNNDTFKIGDTTFQYVEN